MTAHGKTKKPNETGVRCSKREVIGDHELGNLIMDTGDVEVYPCMRCGAVVWMPRNRLPTGARK